VCNWFVQISRSEQRCGYRKLAEKSPETSSNSSPKEPVKEEHDPDLLTYLAFQKHDNPDERPQEIAIVQQVLFKD
jgi:hypothetical protein